MTERQRELKWNISWPKEDSLLILFFQFLGHFLVVGCVARFERALEEPRAAADGRRSLFPVDGCTLASAHVYVVATAISAHQRFFHRHCPFINWTIPPTYIHNYHKSFISQSNRCNSNLLVNHFKEKTTKNSKTVNGKSVELYWIR